MVEQPFFHSNIFSKTVLAQCPLAWWNMIYLWTTWMNDVSYINILPVILSVTIIVSFQSRKITKEEIKLGNMTFSTEHINHQLKNVHGNIRNAHDLNKTSELWLKMCKIDKEQGVNIKLSFVYYAIIFPCIKCMANLCWNFLLMCK